MFDELAHARRGAPHARRPHAALARRDRLHWRADLVACSSSRRSSCADCLRCTSTHARWSSPTIASRAPSRTPDAIAEASQRILTPLLRDGQIPVMGGYIGSAKSNGVTTTLGRGGSDYSASLVGAALQAEAIEIWTDVDGMLTADPRVVQDARLIERIAFDEASELASFGAKVLHPNTIAPAVTKGIPVWILNSRRPEGTGTLITFDAPRRAGDGDRGQERRDASSRCAARACCSPRDSCARLFERVRAAPHVGRRRRDVGGERVGHDRRRRRASTH